MPYTAQQAADNARFVQFAYNMYALGVLNPPPDPGLAQLGFELLLTLTAKDWESVKFYGYVAAPTGDLGNLLLVIRGTETPAEWILDFSALPLPFMNQGFVAAGFRSIAQSFSLTDSNGTARNLSDSVTNLNSTTPITSLTVLGHSLGGALATLAAAELASTNPAGVKPLLSLWTYASPRVGLPDFMNKFNSEVPATFRIWNALDIVPGVPVLPYVHVGGDGEKLTQSQQQIGELDSTPQCEHHLATYQWLLDPADFSLQATGCAFQAPAAAPAVIGALAASAEERTAAESAERPEATADERAQGVAALYKATQEQSK